MFLIKTVRLIFDQARSEEIDERDEFFSEVEVHFFFNKNEI